MNRYLVILIAALIVVVISVQFIFIKKECGYWDEIGITKKCGCTGKITTNSDIHGAYYCSGICSNDCVCRAPYKINESWAGTKEIDCNELDRLVSEGYYRTY